MSVFVIVAALAGILIGGLINVLADDLPYTLHIRRPSYADETPRPAIAWLGLTAFLARRRVAPDDTKLSWRYPAVEVVTTLLFGFTAAEYGFGAVTLFWLGVLAILVLITVIDLEHRLILFVVIIPACLYAIIGAALFNREISDKIMFRDYLFGGLLGFGLFFVIYLGGFVFANIASRTRKEEIDEVAFGYGDVMLATLSGFILGWQALIFALSITVLAGGVGSLLFIIGRLLIRRKYELFTPLPYGQYIVFGTIIMLLWRTPVINYLQGF